MYIEKNVVLGEERNPFTGSCVTVYDDSKKEKVFVAPKVKKIKFHSNYRAVVSGDVIEVYEYDEPIFYGYESVTSKGKNKIGSDSVKRSDSILRSKMAIRRLINSNILVSSKFVTLTYAENVQDVKIAKDDFKKFVKRLNYYLGKKKREKVKYLYVIEFQDGKRRLDKKGRGAVHFHCVFFNLGFIKNSELRELWGNGFVKVNKIDNCDNVGAYVVKYMDKEMNDDRLKSFDLYGRSRGLKEPRIINQPLEVCKLLEAYKNNIVYSKSYSSDYKGQINYCQINLKRINK